MATTRVPRSLSRFALAALLCASAAQAALAPSARLCAPQAGKPAKAAKPAKLDRVDDLIQRGRAALEAGQTSEATQFFAQAEALEPDSLRTRTWVLRGWIAEKRVNDTLDEIDALSKKHANAPEIDYLYGMTFALSAQLKLDQNVNDSSLQMNIEDASAALARATEADPERFHDAWLPLARNAWYAQNLELARGAGERAVELRPKDPEAHFVLGEIALSQYVARRPAEGAPADAEQAKLAEGDWKLADESFATAAQAFEALGSSAAARAASAWTKHGYVQIWKQRKEQAQKSFRKAVALEPEQSDFGGLLKQLEADGLRAVLEGAHADFVAKHGKDDPRDATLLWWLGYARLWSGAPEKGAADFEACLAKNPAFVGCWYWAARCYEAAGKDEAAFESLRKLQDANGQQLIALIRDEGDNAFGMLDRLVFRAQEPVQQMLQSGRADEALPRLANAALGTRLAAESLPAPRDDAAKRRLALYWSNHGLFLRDRASVINALRTRPTDEDSDPRALYERSYEAYTQATLLVPDDPDFLNDAAVVLHYNLKRDYDEVQRMYEKAKQRTQALLADKGTSAELRTHYKTLSGWIDDNLAKLASDRSRAESAPAGDAAAGG
jgi:Tfp pilus assembly protein PilF